MSDSTKKPAIPPSDINKTVKVNLAGIKVATGGGAPQLTEGVYQVKCTRAEWAAGKDGVERIRLTETTQFPVAGQNLSMTLPSHDSESGRNLFGAAVLSHGVPKAALDKGEVDIGLNTFLNKTAYVYYNPAKDANGYDSRRFITKENYEARMAAAATNGAAAAQTSAGTSEALV